LTHNCDVWAQVNLYRRRSQMAAVPEAEEGEDSDEDEDEDDEEALQLDELLEDLELDDGDASPDHDHADSEAVLLGGGQPQGGAGEGGFAGSGFTFGQAADSGGAGPHTQG
jgi:hypothetical protein